MDVRDDPTLFKAHRSIMSEYNIFSNYTKPRGITLLIKKRSGITLGNVDATDENKIILGVLTASNKLVDIATIYAHQTNITRNSSNGCQTNVLTVDTNKKSS